MKFKFLNIWKIHLEKKTPLHKQEVARAIMERG